MTTYSLPRHSHPLFGAQGWRAWVAERMTAWQTQHERLTHLGSRFANRPRRPGRFGGFAALTASQDADLRRMAAELQFRAQQD